MCETTKVCAKCGKEKPLSEFYRQAACSDGCGSYCKECTREYERERYANDPEYQERKRERNREYNRVRYANDPEYQERKRERNRERRANDPEYRERERERYANDPEYRERKRERERVRYANDPEYRERKREYKRERWANDPEYRERHREYRRARRAKNHGLPFAWGTEDSQRALDYWHGRCAYCGEPLADLFGDVVPHMDHYIPISYAGEDNPGTVPENMLPTCSECNLSKNAAMPEEWVERTFGKRKAKGIIKRILEYFEWVEDTMLDAD
jgi:hypothetical protein